MSTVVIWSKLKPDIEFQYGGCLCKLNGMSSQSHLPQCRVLPPGEFNAMIPELHCVILMGAAVLPSGKFNGMSSHSHVSHCRVLPLGEFTCHDSRPTLQGAVTWRNHCHDRATLQSVIIPSAILKIVFCHILFILFFFTVWALMSTYCYYN